jgi:1,5-anhydro-D-fructose reductase (1,5-anhydro-D-mannitol-forming)
MPINWGIVGIGQHVEHFFAPGIIGAADTRLAAVCSRDAEKARRFAEKHGVERYYGSYQEMLEEKNIDVVYVATPNNMHARDTITAAAAKKHVCCEKPMAISETDGRHMIDACRENGVKLGVVFQNRYHPAHIKARQIIQGNEAGEIVLVKAQYCRGFMHISSKSWRTDLSMAGAGALVGAAVHPIDLLRFLLDSEVVEVRALCEPRDGVDDMDYIVLKFQNGMRGVVIAGIQAPRSDNDAVIYGTKLKISCKGTVGTKARGELVVESDATALREDLTVGEVETANFTRLVEDFNRSIRTGSEPGISGSNGLQMTRIVNAVLKSSRDDGKAVAVQRG